MPTIVHFEKVRFRATARYDDDRFFGVPVPLEQEGFVTATESELFRAGFTEVIHDLLNVVATAIITGDATLGNNSGTNTGTGSFTGDAAISDSATVTATATPSGDEVVNTGEQEGTVTATATITGTGDVSGTDSSAPYFGGEYFGS